MFNRYTSFCYIFSIPSACGQPQPLHLGAVCLGRLRSFANTMRVAPTPPGTRPRSAAGVLLNTPEHRRPVPKPDLKSWAAEKQEKVAIAEHKRRELHGVRPPPALTAMPPMSLHTSHSTPQVRLAAHNRPWSAAAAPGLPPPHQRRGQQPSEPHLSISSFTDVGSPLAGEMEATGLVVNDARKQLIDARRMALAERASSHAQLQAARQETESALRMARGREQQAAVAEAKLKFLMEQQNAASRRDEAKAVEALARQRRGLQKDLHNALQQGDLELLDTEQQRAEQELVLTEARLAIVKCVATEKERHELHEEVKQLRERVRDLEADRTADLAQARERAAAVAAREQATVAREAQMEAEIARLQADADAHLEQVRLATEQEARAEEVRRQR